ncbi:hypothetical protein C8J57DRAFT_1475713 [Mycena rebaudengoi]|nr:hypothetical protein C8J57DRAFT_1475713 [Mycena rebaudengoi]
MVAVFQFTFEAYSDGTSEAETHFMRGNRGSEATQESRRPRKYQCAAGGTRRSKFAVAEAKWKGGDGIMSPVTLIRIWIIRRVWAAPSKSWATTPPTGASGAGLELGWCRTGNGAVNYRDGPSFGRVPKKKKTFTHLEAVIVLDLGRISSQKPRALIRSVGKTARPSGITGPVPERVNLTFSNARRLLLDSLRMNSGPINAKKICTGSYKVLRQSIATTNRVSVGRGVNNRALDPGVGRERGVETVSHLRENGCITVLFNAFERPPRIVRLYGQGTVYEFGSPEFNSFIPPQSHKPGTRSVIVVDVYKSCGYAVPFFDFKSHRTRLLAWTAKKEEKNIASAGDSEGRVSGLVDGLKRYWNTKNTKSLDSLTGLTVAPYTSDTFPVKDINYKPDNEATKSQYRFLTMNCAGGMNLVVGFSLGVLATSVYMRMSQ